MENDLGWSRTTLTGALTVATFVSAGLGMALGPLFDRSGARLGMTLSALFGGGVPRAARVHRRALGVLRAARRRGRRGADGAGDRGAAHGHRQLVRAAARRRVRLVGAEGAPSSASPWCPSSPSSSSRPRGAPDGPSSASSRSSSSRRSSGSSYAAGRRTTGSCPTATCPARRATPSRGLSRGVSDEESWTLREAVRTRTLWLIVISIMLTGFPATGVIANMVPYFIDEGLTPTFASERVRVLRLRRDAGASFLGLRRRALRRARQPHALGVRLLTRHRALRPGGHARDPLRRRVAHRPRHRRLAAVAVAGVAGLLRAQARRRDHGPHRPARHPRDGARPARHRSRLRPHRQATSPCTPPTSWARSSPASSSSPPAAPGGRRSPLTRRDAGARAPSPPAGWRRPPPR